ncbi:MAG: LLM class F420-dependent oxidoreductase [Acidimicrobiia bacterium]|nr:LLM class F420-dependent oxidoreductase [Acidimicrobiia bacterium]
MIKLGYQIPFFDYPGVAVEQLFDTVAAQAQAAEASGFDTVLVMDHFYQLPGLGEPDNRMLECYSLLAALAARTNTVKLSSLVTGNTYRNPALLAKTITTLDVISGGRAVLGIGAGWFELEHESLGFEFGTFTDRFERLEEALQIIIPMLRGERPTFEGRHYSVHDAINEPAPISRIPVMIGGSGEKKTLRFVARFADESNLTCGPDEIPHKLEVLAEHCEREGRDRSEISVSWLGTLGIAPSQAEAEAARTEFFASRGLDWDALDDDFRAALMDRIIMGGPDEVAEQVQTKLLDPGLDGLTLNMPVNGHDPEMVALAGETLAPLLTP